MVEYKMILPLVNIDIDSSLIICLPYIYICVIMIEE